MHRGQGIVERFNRTLAERLFGYQYPQELSNPGTRNEEWVLRLPEVIKALNNEVTRLTGKKPSAAIRLNSVKARPASPASRAAGFKEPRLHSAVLVRYLYAPVEREGGERRRATDPIWSFLCTLSNVR